jgi:serine/threonine protein kinase
MSGDTVVRLFGELMDLEAAPREDRLEQLRHLDAGLAAELASLLGADSKSAEILGPLDRTLPRGELAPLPPDPGVSGTVSHYEILERIGGGGMGVVYRARDVRLGRDVALKFLSHPHVQDATARTRFRNEARAASALDHPNLCPVYEYDETPDGRPFIAMALVAGRPLRDRIAEGPLPVAEAVGIAVQAARGLEHAHRAGLVHRDVTPANLLLATDGTVRILDFGVAKRTGGDALTAKGMTLGTIGYMAPEQIKAEAVDARTDVWALGAVLYEMLAGRNPFRGDPRETLSSSMAGRPRRPLRELRPEVSGALEAIVLRCLERDPAARYPTAAALAADLEAR